MCWIFFPTLLRRTAQTLSFNVCLRSCFNRTLTINKKKYEVRWDGSAFGMRSCCGWSRDPVRREAWPCHVRRSVCWRGPHVHTHARIKNETALTVNVLRWHSYSFQTHCGESEEDEGSDVFFIHQVMSNFYLSQWRHFHFQWTLIRDVLCLISHTFLDPIMHPKNKISDHSNTHLPHRSHGVHDKWLSSSINSYWLNISQFLWDIYI